jgi:uncharacterized membrane protein YeaQ/YmgE (transglycosylase-associated protein family)
VSIIAWMVLGLVVGIITEKLLGGREKYGVIITVVIGVAGALLAGWAASTMFHVDTSQGFFSITSWISAIVGAVLLLVIYNAVTGRNGSPRPLRRRAHR